MIDGRFVYNEKYNSSRAGRLLQSQIFLQKLSRQDDRLDRHIASWQLLKCILTARKGATRTNLWCVLMH